MNRLPKDKRDKIIIVGGATIIAVAVLWFVLIQPLRANSGWKSNPMNPLSSQSGGSAPGMSFRMPRWRWSTPVRFSRRPWSAAST